MGRNYRDENERRQILRRYRLEFGDVCPGSPWCSPTPHPETDLTVDHIKPQQHGGTLADGYRILCRTANSKRGNQVPPTPPSRRW